jgi:oligopeptide transport system substrate-binding protein
VRFYPTDDAGAEERAFRAGQLHVTYRVPETKVPVYEAAGTGELHLLPMLRTNFITFNIAKAPFTDARVRRAFSLAVDRVRLVHAALGKLGTPAFSLIRPGTGGFSPAKGFRFDPAEAAAQLGAAGFPGGAGFPAVELTLNGSAGEVLEVAEALQQMWLEYLGVRVTVHPLEFKAYLSVEREKQFQFMFEGYSYLPDPHDLLEGGVTNDPENDAGASNPEYDAAVAASDSTTDEKQRRAAFDAAEAVNAREVYFAPVYFTNRGRLIVPSVRGWRDNGIGYIDWREISLDP